MSTSAQSASPSLPKGLTADLFGGASAKPNSAVLPNRSAGALPAFMPGSVPGFPTYAPPAIDWAALLSPLLAGQANPQVPNLLGSLGDQVPGAVSSALESAAAWAGDMAMYSAYSDNGAEILDQLRDSINALPTDAEGQPQWPAPDMSGLPALGQTLADQFMALGQLDPGQLPPPLTPAQVLALSAAVRAIPGGLVPPAPIGLPEFPAPPDMSYQPAPPPVVDLPSMGSPVRAGY